MGAELLFHINLILYLQSEKEKSLFIPISTSLSPCFVEISIIHGRYMRLSPFSVEIGKTHRSYIITLDIDTNTTYRRYMRYRNNRVVPFFAITS
jgi:hypothetical protein